MIFLLSWPFLIAPGQFLYVRYFDADTLFGPFWKLRDLVNVWDAQSHLGYAHARDLSYLSIQEIVSALMSPLGSDFRNRSSLVCVALFVFLAFWCYLRVHFHRVPGTIAAVAAFFYAANPFVVAFIHDGYSGLLVDYALLPVALLIVEWARRRGRPLIVSFIPLLFLLTGMYNLTSVLVALIGTAVLEFEYLWNALRTSRVAAWATALAFSLNLYWLLPLLYDLAIHPKQPILAESAGDISVLTSAGTLTNAFLLRSYPELWTKAYGTRECVGCAFYESPWFMMAMFAIAVCAIVGLLRARRIGLLVALAASILIATGYHYQSEILGIPYLILMGLPTFDAFRSNVKFSALTAAFYSIGLMYFYVMLPRWRARFAVASAIAVVLIALPYVTGRLIERSPDSPPRFPNFVVTIPEYYSELRQHANLLPDERPTLMLPNMPLAAYRWGAYGNDFLPAFLGKPTLAVSYLPQPSWQMEQILQKLTARRGSREGRQSLLRALGISRILYRDDVGQTYALAPSEFGKPLATFGAMHVLDSAGAFPQFAVAREMDPVSGVTGIASYAGFWSRPTRGFDGARDGAAVCAGRAQIGLDVVEIGRKHTQVLAIPTTCSHKLHVALVLDRAGVRDFGIAEDGRVPTVLRVASGPRGTALATFVMPAGRHTYIISGRRNAIVTGVAGVKISRAPYRIMQAAWSRVGQVGYRFEPLPFSHYLIFNQNFDPSWAGYVQADGRWRPLSNFMADGYANAWDVPAQTPLVIVNTLQITAWIAAALTLLLLALYLYVLARGLRGDA